MKALQQKRHTRCAVTLAVLAVLAFVALGSRRIAKAQDAGTLNLVYVESNISSTNGNTVLGFSNTGGVLTPLSGSPYFTGGTGVASGGTGDQFDADQQVIANPEGTLLFAVNGHSNDISVFSIDSTGNLTRVGGPVASGGQDPASVGLKDNALGGGNSFLVAVNKDSDPNQTGGTPNYTTFTVDSAGTMTENAGSTFNIAVGSSPAQALMSPLTNQSTFFGIEFMNQQVVSYHLSKTGRISKLNSSTPPVATPVVLGAAIDPKFRNTFYVASPPSGVIATYTYNSAGTLTFVTDVPDPGAAVCWLTFNAAGTRLYSAETASGTVTVYNTGNPSHPTQLQHFTLAQFIPGQHALPANLALDATGSYLYVVDGRGALHVLVVSSTGTLSEPNAPVSLGLPTGTVPMGIAVVSK